MTDKRTLRRQIRSLYPGEEERNRQSCLMCGHILASRWYREAQVLAGYMPMDREADVRPVLTDALARGKTLVLPRCEEAPRMTLRRITDLSELCPGAYGLLEPREDAPVIPAAQVDLILTPLEGVSPRGLRLGKGAGYYDCLLAGGGPRTMGCAMSWQWVHEVPAEPWDVPLDACADMTGVRYFRMDENR